ncbi:MAG: DUF4405 domain-containing protein, partial [Spirochaetaceae bacterium]|nr:DUF4405 domain-containing protein [Spirochaetaceae bacterium]
MNKKMVLRLVIDLVMTLLLLAAFDYRLTREIYHEWIGISLLCLFVVHNILNINWYKNIFKGRYNFQRCFVSAVNLLLLVTMLILMASGLLQSRSVLKFLHLTGFKFLQLQDGMLLRQIHTCAAYWGLLLIAVHIGIHFEMIKTGFRKMFKITRRNIIRKIILCLIALSIVFYGVWSSFDRSIFSKLFLNASFDFWDTERSPVFFY